MIEFKYWLYKKRERLIFRSWALVPNSWLYYAVMTVWAKATIEKYTSHSQNQVTWSMACNFLKGRDE